MDLQFIKLLNRALVPEYSYMAYAKGGLQQYLNDINAELAIVGKPFIVSFKNIDIANKTALIDKDLVIKELSKLKDISIKKAQQMSLDLFTFEQPNFVHVIIPIVKHRKYRIDNILDNLSIIDKPVIFNDRYLHVEFDNINNGTIVGHLYENITRVREIDINEDSDLLSMLDNYRFVNLNLTNVMHDNIKEIFRIIKYYFTYFRSKFKYTTFISAGCTHHCSTVDKVNIAFIKYSEFYPVFTNDDIYCLLVQLTSSKFNDLTYYTRDGYVANYMIGGSNSRDDLLEIDGEQNILCPRVNISYFLKAIWTILNVYTCLNPKNSGGR